MQLVDLLRSRAVTIGAAAVLALAVAGGAAWFFFSPAIQSLAGGEVKVGGPFKLTDQHGAEVTERDFAGRYMLIYFGYTFCPDFCPLSLANMTRALDLLPPGRALARPVDRQPAHHHDQCHEHRERHDQPGEERAGRGGHGEGRSLPRCGRGSEKSQCPSLNDNK